MEIDELILIHQLAQGLIDTDAGERWFVSLGTAEKTAALRDVNFMIANASPRREDIPKAIEKSGLKTTSTPCVLLRSGEVRTQIAKIANLPENELLKAFRLLLALLGVCDLRRRTEKPLDIRNHWWHRDLKDPAVISEIRHELRKK